MPDPSAFTIKPHGRTWILERDGRRIADYSHLEQATHVAVRLGRELQETGEPARVFVEAAEGKVIEIELGPEVTRAEELHGPDLD